MFNRIVAVSALLLGTVWIEPASAASISYDVNLAFGGGSVVGSITTNGSFGILSTASITGFNLTLNGVGASTNIASPSAAVLIQGGDVSATASNVFFDFSGSDSGFLLFQQTLFTGQQYFCSATAKDVCFQGKSVVPQSIVDPSAVNVAASGKQVIGTVSTVPLPSSLPMFGAALLAVGSVGYRLKRRLGAA